MWGKKVLPKRKTLSYQPTVLPAKQNSALIISSLTPSSLFPLLFLFPFPFPRRIAFFLRGLNEVRVWDRNQHCRLGWGCSSVGGASDRHATDTGSIPRCSKGFFYQRQLSLQTPLRCPYTPRVYLHALTFLHTLKIL